MSYLQFLLIFTVVPLLVLLYLLRKRMRSIPWRTILLLILIAFLYTAPWDNLIILNKVWSYSPTQVLGLTIGLVPLEEYLFYGLQVTVTALFCVWLARRLSRR